MSTVEFDGKTFDLGPPEWSPGSSPHVYVAISAITGELAKTGITKEQTNTFDQYKFRGIDDVYNALSGLLAKYKLCIIPRVATRDVVERQSQKGGALFYVSVEVHYDIMSAVDGSRHTASVIGEAMDRGDKATNKAMSAAYKYLCLQLFCIPTEGDNDADASTHEVKPAPEIPPDVRTALEEAAAVGADEARAAFKALSQETRLALTTHHRKWLQGLTSGSQRG